MEVNESTWARRVCTRVQCWSWKIHTSLRRGIPDALFVGPKGTLWAEFKLVRTFTRTLYPARLLTSLQAKTLKDLHRLNQPVAVIIRHPEGFILLQGLAWETPLQRSETPNLTLEEVVDYIHQTVGHVCTSSPSSSPSLPSSSSSDGSPPQTKQNLRNTEES